VNDRLQINKSGDILQKRKEGSFVMSSIVKKVKAKIKAIPLLELSASRIQRFLQRLYWRQRSKHDEIKLLLDKMQEKLKIIENDYNEPKMTNVVSQLVTQSQLESEAFKRWCYEIKETPRYHRKQWEYAYVLQGLYENDLLRPGTLGLGFGVGKEPLPAVMAKYGCKVIATDMDIASAKKAGWVETNQYSTSKNDLNKRGICDVDKFNKLVSFQIADMNNIPARLKSMRFDFIWSCCAVDHLGSIELGIKFIKETVKLLKPGGISIHTTEYNVLSNDDTLDNQGTVLFRRKDIELLVNDLRLEGYHIYFNPHTGNGYIDKHIDIPPYADNNHLKLLIGKYVSTSIGLLIKRV
jgi:SAM-dependent methyltransferase